MKSEANLFPKSGSNPTVTFSDNNKSNIAVCFSGGGTRAMTCAWGQYLGLKALGLNDTARYISSVSGGTWASSVYNFLPGNISTEDLLGDYFNPADLSLSDEKGKFNVNNLGEHSFGQAPLHSTLPHILESVALFLLLHEEKHYKWLWASIVAKYILEPFGLRNEGTEIWNSTKSFSLSSDYVNAHFPPEAPNADELVFLREGRPFLVINNNILQPISAPGEKYNVVMLPNQSTPVATGGNGATPEGYSRNGAIASYGNNAILEQSNATDSPVNIDIEQPYSLIDAVSTSSAFFADLLASHLKEILNNGEERKNLIKSLQGKMSDDHKQSFLQRIKGDLEKLGGLLESELIKIGQSLNLTDIVPVYNVWRLGPDTANRATQYTDGGSLENTGILGLLAQTDEGGNEPAINVLAFDNTSTPLTKVGGQIVAGGQIAPLFGINYDEKTGNSEPFTAAEQDPTNEAFIATSLIQIFDNSAGADGKTPFENLVSGLYNTNSDNGTAENSAPAFSQLSLTTIDNSLASITSGRSVQLVYVQNAKMLNWQNAIGDEQLKQQITEGQEASASETTSFKNFPYYNLFFKIGLEAKESNAMAQMWAWAIADDGNELSNVIKTLFATT